MLTAIAAGLSFFEAQEMATLVAAMSVTSEHTINKEIDCESLQKFVTEHSIKLSESIKRLLKLKQGS